MVRRVGRGSMPTWIAMTCENRVEKTGKGGKGEEGSIFLSVLRFSESLVLRFLGFPNPSLWFYSARTLARPVHYWPAGDGGRAAAWRSQWRPARSERSASRGTGTLPQRRGGL